MLDQDLGLFHAVDDPEKHCLLVDRKRVIEETWEAISGNVRLFATTTNVPLKASPPRIINMADDPQVLIKSVSLEEKKGSGLLGLELGEIGLEIKQIDDAWVVPCTY